ncbi:MAG: hypothetical protein J7M17_09160 [Anaerolineae bacterium]|nr:hypothetical protein [Anaerolineae bacterium]
MTTDLTAALERAHRALAILEAQAAGYTALTIPVHLKLDLEAKRREVAELEARLPRAATAPPSPIFDQRGQQVGTQINVAGDYHAPPPAQPSITGDGNVVGDGNVGQVTKAAPPAATSSASTPAALRARLQRLDSVELETLCLDHFPVVYDKFARGLQRGEMVNLLLDHCRRNPEDGARLADLLKWGMTDVFAAYERGLAELLKRLGKDHLRYAEALTLQTRLLKNIAQARRYGDTETRRAERAQIVDALNRLAVEAVGKSFNEWCGMPADEEAIQNGIRSPSLSLPPRRKQPMRNRRLVLAFVISTGLSLLVGLLSDLVATYMAPSLADQLWLVYGALVVTFVIALPISIYLFLHGLPEAEVPAPLPVQEVGFPHTPTEPGTRMFDLSVKSYRELVGRDALLGEVMAALRDPAGKWMVTIDGMGGIGKTALAREVADRCLAQRLFDVVVWEQAPKEELSSRNHRQGTGMFTFEIALDAIARQLGALDVPRLKGVEKEARVRTLLQSQRVLVVLDNLETAKEPQNEIACRLRSLLEPSKALLTSRHRFKGDLYAIHLAGLDGDGALRFIRQEAEEKGIKRVATAQPEELGEIAQTTGGSPLALKLIVGQLDLLPMNVVLEQLREVQVLEGETAEDDYLRFYKFIFFPSWHLLSDDGKRLLISRAHFAPSVGGTYEAVKVTSDLPDEALRRSIDELWRLSFLEMGESPSLKQVRYYLHALTQYFVLSDIVQVLE